MQLLPLRSRWLCTAAAILAAIPAAAAEPLTGKVVRVHDGDTVHCLRGDNVTLKVRLQAIDAPELGQAAAIMLLHLS